MNGNKWMMIFVFIQNDEQKKGKKLLQNAIIYKLCAYIPSSSLIECRKLSIDSKLCVE